MKIGMMHHKHINLNYTYMQFKHTLTSLECMVFRCTKKSIEMFEEEGMTQTNYSNALQINICIFLHVCMRNRIRKSKMGNCRQGSKKVNIVDLKVFLSFSYNEDLLHKVIFIHYKVEIFSINRKFSSK